MPTWCREKRSLSSFAKLNYALIINHLLDLINVVCANHAPNHAECTHLYVNAMEAQFSAFSANEHLGSSEVHRIEMGPCCLLWPPWHRSPGIYRKWSFGAISDGLVGSSAQLISPAVHTHQCHGAYGVGREANIIHWPWNGCWYSSVLRSWDSKS
jgi:hypothetical protein